MEQADKDGTAVPTSAKEVGTRISAVVDRFAKKKTAANVAGISTDQLNRYIGGSDQRLGPIGRMCAATGVRIDWVWTGAMPMQTDSMRAAIAHEFNEYRVRVKAGEPMTTAMNSFIDDYNGTLPLLNRVAGLDKMTYTSLQDALERYGNEVSEEEEIYVAGESATPGVSMLPRLFTTVMNAVNQEVKSQGIDTNQTADIVINTYTSVYMLAQGEYDALSALTNDDVIKVIQVLKKLGKFPVTEGKS